MATVVQFRGGDTSQNNAFRGASKELTVDTQKHVVVVHDGSNDGGHPLMAEDGTNSALGLGSAGTPALKFTDTNTGIYSPGADQIALSTGGTARFYVGSDGKVGIGETAPDALLVIRGSSDANTTPSIRLKDVNSNVLDTREAWITNASGDLSFNTGGDDNAPHGTLKIFDSGLLDFAQAAGSRLRIDASGNVGINQTSPSAKLDVNGNVQFGDGGGFDMNINGSRHQFSLGSSEKMRLTSTGLGIGGQRNPAVLLDLESTSPTIRLTDSDASGTPECQISGAGGDLVLAADRDNEKSDSLIRFQVDGIEQMTVKSDGRINMADIPAFTDDAAADAAAAATPPTLQSGDLYTVSRVLKVLP